ncbi:MAG TPA: protein translocase subunit SecF, partial [Propionibacteriaceae bacterium]
LFAGAVILGEGPLKDLALALFVGMISGAYSSIFIATPLLAQLKEREPDMQKLATRVAARRAKQDQKSRPVDPDHDASEPSDAELASVAAADAPAVRVTTAGATPPVRTFTDGTAKRPQPQHKPRSQRKR